MSFDFESYQQKLRDLRDQLEKDDQALKIAVTDTVDQYYDRIFIEGKKTDGSNLDYVSKKPVYINTKKNSPRQLSPIGKTGKSKFASGKAHVTTYFESYKKFKSEIGKRILELIGSLQSSVASGTKKLEDGSYILGVAEKEGKKIEGLQYGNGEWSGFGTIFKLSTEEKRLFFDTYKLEMRKGLTQ